MPNPVIFHFQEAVSICSFLGKCQCGAGAGLSLLGLVCAPEHAEVSGVLSPLLCNPNAQVRAHSGVQKKLNHPFSVYFEKR